MMWLPTGLFYVQEAVTGSRVSDVNDVHTVWTNTKFQTLRGEADLMTEIRGMRIQQLEHVERKRNQIREEAVHGIKNNK